MWVSEASETNSPEILEAEEGKTVFQRNRFAYVEQQQ